MLDYAQGDEGAAEAQVEEALLRLQRCGQVGLRESEFREPGVLHVSAQFCCGSFAENCGDWHLLLVK